MPLAPLPMWPPMRSDGKAAATSSCAYSTPSVYAPSLTLSRRRWRGYLRGDSWIPACAGMMGRERGAGWRGVFLPRALRVPSRRRRCREHPSAMDVRLPYLDLGRHPGGSWYSFGVVNGQVPEASGVHYIWSAGAGYSLPRRPFQARRRIESAPVPCDAVGCSRGTQMGGVECQRISQVFGCCEVAR